VSKPWNNGDELLKKSIGDDLDSEKMWVRKPGVDTEVPD